VITLCNAKAKQIKTKKKKKEQWKKWGSYSKALLIISTSNSSLFFVLGFNQSNPTHSSFTIGTNKAKWCYYSIVEDSLLMISTQKASILL
jgi:hypothetical protein